MLQRLASAPSSLWQDFSAWGDGLQHSAPSSLRVRGGRTGFEKRKSGGRGGALAAPIRSDPARRSGGEGAAVFSCDPLPGKSFCIFGRAFYPYSRKGNLFLKSFVLFLRPFLSLLPQRLFILYFIFSLLLKLDSILGL